MIRAVEVWCPGLGCRQGVHFDFPNYRPQYVPERSCALHVPLSDDVLFRLGQVAYRKYEMSTPYLWGEYWEGDPWYPGCGRP